MGIKFSTTNRVTTRRSQREEEIKLFLNNETPQSLSTNPNEQQQHDQLISSFLEVAVGQTAETAKRFLQTTNWNIEESINLFLHDKNYIYEPSMYNEDHVAKQNSRTFDDAGESDSTLSSMYRPPVDLLFQRHTLEEAKSTSCARNLWLLVNLQSRTEFASHALNRDVWSDDTVSEAVESSFVLWQVYDNTIEGKKISSFYKIDSAPPVVLVIDPITGLKMRMWSGGIEAQSFVEDLSWFLESAPYDSLDSLIRERYSWEEGFEESAEVEEEENGLEFPVLTEEPQGDCDKSLVCTVCVRFLDGRRRQRRFLKSEPVQLLWSFCYSHMEELEGKAFKLVHAIPGAFKTLDYEVDATFEESGLANSMISVAWDSQAERTCLRTRS